MEHPVALPRDPAGFVRRECPACERQFKSRGGPLDGACVQRHLVRKVLHHNPDEAPGELPPLHCPYCGHGASQDAFLTPQQRAYLSRVGRALGDELRYQQLMYVRRALADNPSPTFVPMAPVKGAGPVPYEPDDMRVEALLCCVEDVKVEAHWAHPVRCPRCGTDEQSVSHVEELWGPPLSA